MRPKLTATFKTKVTKDWQTELPAFGILKPGSLLKLNGPVAVGVYLKPSRGGDSYVPTAHVHCLCGNFDFVTLALGSHAKMIKTTEHQAGVYKARVAELVKSAPFILRDDLSLSVVLARYRWFLDQRKYGDGVAPYLATYTDIVSLLIWCGFVRAATTLRARICRAIDALPEPERAVPSVADWLSPPRPPITSQDEMATRVTRHIADLKLAKLPAYDLVLDCNEGSVADFNIP